MCHQILLLLPVKSGSLELPTAVMCSLLGLENMIPRKRAEAAAFCMLISTKHMPVYNLIYIRYKIKIKIEIIKIKL